MALKAERISSGTESSEEKEGEAGAGADGETAYAGTATRADERVRRGESEGAGAT